jgi:hypothetical protein
MIWSSPKKINNTSKSDIVKHTMQSEKSIYTMLSI